MVMPNVTAQMLELHHAGKLRMLAVTRRERLVGAPDIPTAVEAGLPGMISQNFIGLFAPARTPPAVSSRRSRRRRVLRSPIVNSSESGGVGFRARARFHPGKDQRVCRGGDRALDADHQIDRAQARLIALGPAPSPSLVRVADAGMTAASAGRRVNSARVSGRPKR